MLEFVNVNVNPKGRKTGDCSTRALVGVLGLTYDEALRAQCEESIKGCYGITDKETIDRIMKSYGYVKCKQPRQEDGTKYMVKELDKILSPIDLDNGVLVKIAGHFTCVRGNQIQDIWNCGYKTIGNYWVKVRGEI